jgi:glycosyltransferase involved in cell wall biosynthesis
LTERLDIFLPSQLVGRGPSYTCAMIAQGMVSRDLDSRGLEVNIVTPRARAFAVSPVQVIETLPYWARYLPYRLVRPLALSTIDDAFLRATRTGSARNHGAYIWPNASLTTINELKRAQIKVFREMINGPRWVAKRILDEAYRRLGITPSHGLDDVSSQAEREALHAVDYVFSPNGMVTASLLETGLQPQKILEASYGWDPRRFSGTERLLPPIDGITIMFVGTICVRKGAHLLLDYWARSKLRGRLVLAGAIEPAIKEACAGLLARDDVKVLDYVSNAGALYRSADIFAFPTLEEGGPQVTYEACGCGLPVITTPMGAGRIARDGQEGFVLDPYDATGWITAMQTLAEDVSQRRSMGLIARETAKLYHWDIVAAHRKRQVLDRLQTTYSGSRKDALSTDGRLAADAVSTSVSTSSRGAVDAA